MLDRTNNETIYGSDGARIGHNGPPGPIDSAKEAHVELSKFAEDNPVIETFEQAKTAGGFIERTRIALNAMEDERKPLVEPLNKELEAINSRYRVVKQPLEKLYELIKARVTKFNNAVETKRKADAELLRKQTEAAEQAARDAEAREKEAIEGADVGECTDVGGAIAEADGAFADYQRAGRTLAIAERNIPMRIPSAMGGKTLSMRTYEVLVIDDPAAAIVAMGLTDGIKEAIIKDAKKFRDALGELPDGVRSTQERKL